MKANEILDLPMRENDAEAETVRDYIKTLAREVFLQDEGFSGKRPFGNSGWKYELYAALVSGGAVAGRLDTNGYVDWVDVDPADDAILEAIEALA